jgi:ABC-type dipeptide/oligopeptide/nickel transport system permease subunit
MTEALSLKPPAAPEASRDGAWKRGGKKFARNRAALVGGLLIVGYVLTAVGAPLLYPKSPTKTNLMMSLERPSLKHPLGTDELGRSILGRMIWGSRISLLIAVGVVGFGLVIGVPLGLISGYYGGKVDFILQRITDVLLAFPGFLLALALVAVLGVGMKNTVVSIGISMVPLYIRLVRGCALAVREQTYVESARAVGTRDLAILTRYILPNVLVPIIVQSSLGMGIAILFAAGLGFLGIGIQPPTPEWGAMLGSGRAYIFNAPHVATFPGIAIFGAVLGFNLMGDGLRDALDPRFKI